MSNNQILISTEKMKLLKAEYERLVSIDRPTNIKSIQVARSQGDLSENADYSAAKEKQGEIENRIAEIEYILSNCTILDEDNQDNSVVTIGKKVTIYDESTKDEEVYEIVGDLEVDLLANKISNLSPLAKSIEGKKVGDKIKVINIERPYFIEIKKIS
jgi:transcription elongation factor GreA